MECSTNLPQAAFFSTEEKVQLISGNCPRHITKERLKEWLSFRKGTAKDGSARSEARERGSLTLSPFMKLISQKKFIEEKKGTMLSL